MSVSSSTARSVPVASVRAATAAQHRGVERRLDVRAAFASVDAYGAMLARLLGFHAPLEAELRRASPAVTGVPPVPRRERLEADLVAVGRDPSSISLHPTPLGLPVDEAGRVGTAYVIEGSALGGAVLARLADRRLGLTAEHGASFFHGDAGPATDLRWQRVLAAIDAEAELDRLPGVIAGAIRTFDVLDAWLART